MVAYLGLVVLFDAGGRLFGSLGDIGLFFGIPLLVAVLYALVRFFVAPAFAVTGSGPIAALRHSARLTRGSGRSIFVLVLSLGLAAWLLSIVPYAGPVVSSALVAPTHAVATAVARERVDGVAHRRD